MWCCRPRKIEVNGKLVADRAFAHKNKLLADHRGRDQQSNDRGVEASRCREWRKRGTSDKQTSKLGNARGHV